MKRLLLICLTALALSVSFANAQTPTQQLCYTTNGVNCAPSIQTSVSVPIAISSATTAVIISANSKTIYVTNWNAISSATGTLQFVYGTGTNCGTGTINLTGAYTFGASTPFSVGNGLGPIFQIPLGNDLCAVSTSTLNIQGSISFARF